MALVSQGRKILDVVEQAVVQLQDGNSKQATGLLDQLKGDIGLACDATQKFLLQMNALEDYYKLKVEVNYHATHLIYIIKISYYLADKLWLLLRSILCQVSGGIFYLVIAVVRFYN